MQIWPAGSPLSHCKHILPLPSWHTAILLYKHTAWVYSSPPCMAPLGNLALPDDAIWIYFWICSIYSQILNVFYIFRFYIWIYWMRNLSSDTWQSMINMRHRVSRFCQQNTATFINTLQYVCASESTCCGCMLLCFLLTSPEEMIMRQNEKEIKTFHEMITFQCFSKHFEDACQCWCYMYPSAWPSPLLKPAKSCPFISMNTI